VDEKNALREAQAFRDRFAHLYPSAVKSFEDDLEVCLNHLKCPPRHRRFITSTNLVGVLSWRRNAEARSSPASSMRKAG
jgi:transposase-like protein